MRNLDSLKRISIEAYDFIKAIEQDSYPDGRYELKNGVYVNIDSYSTQYRSERRFEAHRRYIDIQYMIIGSEIITLCKAEGLNISESYDYERDIEFYDNSLCGIDNVLGEGDYLIIYPDEAHMPCICIGEKKMVKKAVIKIPYVI